MEVEQPATQRPPHTRIGLSGLERVNPTPASKKGTSGKRRDAPRKTVETDEAMEALSELFHHFDLHDTGTLTGEQLKDILTSAGERCPSWRIL